MMRALHGFCLLFLLCISNGNCASLEVNERTLIVSGIIHNGDFERMSKLLLERDVNTIEFDNCLGGLVDVGYKMSRLIREKKLNTVAKRQCHSSCALGFLAGQERKFSQSSGDHFILLHAARNVENPRDSVTEANLKLIQYIHELTELRLSFEVLDMIKNSRLPGSGVVFAKTGHPPMPKLVSLYCDGSEDGRVQECKTLSGVDVLSMGVVTSR